MCSKDKRKEKKSKIWLTIRGILLSRFQQTDRDRINNSHLSYMQIWITNAEHEENVLQYFLNE